VSVARPLSAPAAARDLDGLRAQLACAAEAASLQALGLGGVLLGHGTLNRVGEIAAALRRDQGDVVVIADTRPMDAPHGEVKTMVAGLLEAAALPVRRVVVGDDDGVTHADVTTIDAAVNASADAGLLVSVGSGTVADIGKAVCAALEDVPHVVVQTAASVNGFADDQSVLLIDGVKRTVATRWPDRLLIDTDVIARAPVELNRAGLGDLLATYTGPADWLLARLVGQDPSYSTAAVAVARSHVDAVLDAAAGIDAADPDAIDNLAAALTLSGIAMGVAGRTAPGSGMEHTVSHLIEMAQDGSEAAALHGAKVGVLSVLAAMLWGRVRVLMRDGGHAALRFPDGAALRPRVLGAFAELDPSGRTGEECWRAYSLKLERWHAARERLADLPEQWPEFDAELDALLTEPARLVHALRAAGAPRRLRELGVDGETARWALSNCQLMRDRFTVADLAFFLGAWEPADVEQLLIDAERLGTGL
jgi:glycerol-1-phosphate dehydrogenase [NAD(P)+]